jgi:serine protease Do
MNESNNNTYELIEQYCLDLMDERERHYFELEMEKNPALSRAVHEHKTIVLSFDHLQSSQFVHATLDTLHNHSRSQTDVIINQLKLHVNRYWKTASVAASVAFLASFLTFLAARSVYNKDAHARYQLLRTDINRIKKDQSSIKKDISTVKKNVAQVPEGPSKYLGSSFALTQSGYMVTNLHVVDGFSKIFVFTKDGVGHQSELIASDQMNDLAILKITEEDFKFNEKIPYSVRKMNPNIAQRVYSMGYPKDDIVYNEGYISSTTGFEGDSSRYQLELPSGPGVSGAPILDETGNIIGIISGKQSQSEGITYAIHAKSLMNLFGKMPKDFSSAQIASNSLKGINRASQVKKIEPFVCVVKVYN